MRIDKSNIEEFLKSKGIIDDDAKLNWEDLQRRLREVGEATKRGAKKAGKVAVKGARFAVNVGMPIILRNLDDFLVILEAWLGKPISPKIVDTGKLLAELTKEYQEARGRE